MATSTIVGSNLSTALSSTGMGVHGTLAWTTHHAPPPSQNTAATAAVQNTKAAHVATSQATNLALNNPGLAGLLANNGLLIFLGLAMLAFVIWVTAQG